MSDEKEVKILIVTEADLANAESLDELLEKAEANADSLSQTLGELDSSGLEDASTSADNLSTSTEEASTNADDLNSSLGSVDGSGLDDAASSADNLTGSLEDAAGSADNVGESLSVIESTSLLGAAGEIQGYAGGAENLAQQMNTAAISVGQLATQTGIAEPQLVSLINNISNATFPQEEAMMYVQALDQMGVSAGKLGASATDMDSINDAFGIGASQVTQLTANLKVLGVSADNLPASFNALAYAQSNVVGGVDKFNMVLQRLGPAFSQYGYNVDQAAVITAAATQKWGSGRKAMSELSSALKEAGNDSSKLEQALGLQAGALSNASAATGQYAGQVQKMADEEAQHKTILDQVGAALEDVALSFNGIISPMAGFIGMLGQFGGAIVQLNALAQLIQLMRDWEIVTKAVEAAQWLLNLSLWSNPYVIIAVAIIALIAALWYLYNTNEDVRNAIDAFGQALWGIGEAIYGTIMGALEWLNNQIQWLRDSFQSASDTIMTYAPLIAQVLFVMATGGVGAIVLLVANFMGMPNQVGGALQSVITRVAGFVGDIVGRLANGARQAVSNFVSGIAELPERVFNELQRTLDRVMDWGSQIVGRLGEIAQRAWQAFVSGLGIGSPGYIQILTLKELDDTGKRVPQVASRIVTNLNKAAGEAVDAWGTPTFEYGFANDDIVESSKSAVNHGSSGQVSYTFNLYGDIDNEERMQRFVDEVRRQIDWNNETAGRTMDVI